MCYESMHWSKDHQIKLLRERKQALKDRMAKIDEMLAALEKEKEPAAASA